MSDLDMRIEQWKKRLLDLSKRNRLINFRETKRSNVTITSPSYTELFQRLVNDEESLNFSFPIKVEFDENDEEEYSSFQIGDLETNKSINEQQKTLKVLRGRAKTVMEEQGINPLFLTFGIIRWKESADSDVFVSSPLVLVPVSLTVASIKDPYVLNIHEDEIVINPTLIYKFENDFGLTLPEFDGHEDSIEEFISVVTKIIKANNWELTTDVHLSLLSFLKINMYKDLELNRDKIVSNPIVKALNSDKSEICQIPKELNNYNHDKGVRPIETFQVVDADSSQQDAILLSRKGVSFVLQGPPGTGKSQTITNIIAEALSEGKKILFVSEKMAALDVVKKRLAEAGLEDFCLTLHSYKANKKEVLAQLSKTLNIPKKSLREEALFKLSVLEQKRNKLNDYHAQLHDKCQPLNISIYDAQGRLSRLINTQDIIFDIDSVADVDNDKLNNFKYLLIELSKTMSNYNEDYLSNPWYDCNVSAVTHELRHNIDVNLTELTKQIKDIIYEVETISSVTGISKSQSYNSILEAISFLEFCIQSTLFPEHWLSCDIEQLIIQAQQWLDLQNEYREKRELILKSYDESVFSLDANLIFNTINESGYNLLTELKTEKYPDIHSIIKCAPELLNETQYILTKFKHLSELSSKFYEITGIHSCDSLSELSNIENLLSLICVELNPLRNWFHIGKIAQIKQLAEEALKQKIIFENKSQEIAHLFQDDIITENYSIITKKFKNEYAEFINAISRVENGNAQLIIGQLRDFQEIACNILKIYSEYLSNSKSLLVDLQNSTDIKPVNTLNDLINLLSLLRAISKNPKPTESWFDDSKSKVVEKLIKDFKHITLEKETETESLLNHYNKDILSIDAKGMLARFNTEYNNFLKVIKKNYRDDKKKVLSMSEILINKVSDTVIVETLKAIISIQEKEEWISNHKSIAQQLLGSLYLDEYTDWDDVKNCREVFDEIKQYFSNGRIPEKLKHILLNGNVNIVDPVIEEIIKLVDENTIILISKLLGKDIKTNTFYSVLSELNQLFETNQNMQEDILVLLKHSSNEDTFNNANVEQLITTSENIRNVISINDWYNAKSEMMKSYYESYYQSYKTDWEDVLKRISVTEKIIFCFGKKNIPKKFIDFICEKNETPKLVNDFMELIQLINQTNLPGRVVNLFKEINSENLKVDTIIIKTEQILFQLKETNDKYLSFSRNASITSLVEPIMSDLVLLVRIQEIEGLFISNQIKLNEFYSFKYNGVNTDWYGVLSSLNFATHFNDYNLKYNLARSFISSIASDYNMLSWCREHLDILKSKYNNLAENFTWYVSMFDNQEIITEASLFIILDRLERSFDFRILEQWIDFKNVREQCRDIGLSDFVQKVKEYKIKPDMIETTFFKRFYRLWLDIMLDRHPAVLTFRESSQNALIGEFVSLDKEQLKIARLRIIERLVARLPDSDYATSSVDEVGILKRELAKQKKLKPLRRLFREIPNLLTALKPCLMMSPLSVSLYLQADGYDFDLIIFDEASQVCTEDAIGAIVRGKQVVIAGDRNQLPPTNFFAATLSDNDYDTEDEEEDDTGAYSSILEEASNAIPERTLKWHYRSRHEHLIAFSNAKIYNHELITFPSNIDKVRDNGVEYIFVEDGVYDRGGKKNNVNEAKRVAQLVFEHFKKFPNRSLGVVTFSEAQQQAVESAIHKMRINDPSFENFFLEDTEQAFFIKNLENVQGDERDTIIFSIGYAKDQNKQMYMNFGPLSRNGGHKRLNVAITRAKYNVKLVGSIHPTDIKSDITAEGVRLLRQYIEFAINGISAIQNELTFSNTVDVESPFEESVYDFLTLNGYSVQPQVGCSGYRIDMAVKHPTLSGVFVLGVECDGATYHSARTARERDRLRQSVLEDIGWKIYRIWSTDWVKNQKLQGEKLLATVQKAISEYTIEPLSKGFQLEEDAVTSIIDGDIYLIEQSEKKIETDETVSPYGFVYYQDADLSSLQNLKGQFQYHTSFIEEVVKQEGPIHFEMLCKKYAPLMGYQKASEKVQSAVRSIIGSKLQGVIVLKDNFCWHNSVTNIKVRIPAQGSNGRPINYICKEELGETMCAILDKSFGISKNDLFVFSARAYGFNRIGGNITASLEHAYRILIEKQWVKEVDDKVVLIK